jgi:MSHA biogenesis protein MshQ
VGTGPATGEISADPQFLGATDFHILVTSPARDTGTDASAVTAEDRDGTPRPQRLGYDMGAYEVLEVFDHFEVVHDGFGIHCLGEVVVVRAIATDGDPFDFYDGSVTLTTGSGKGTWSSTGGNAGSFVDPVANDGEAFYTFDDADDGEAIFVLDYPEGPPAIDVDVFENGDPTRIDDDGEGLLVWSPSGFTVTANPLPNPPPDPIFDPIATQTAAVPFSVHITAYGQTPTDPLCGVIEGYDGPKNLEFWSRWDDPATGTLAVQIDGVAIGTSEAAATPRPVAFVAGQAVVTARYDDVGRIQISMKDTSVVEPAAGIRGATNPFVVRPADFVLSGIQRSADAFPNPDPPALDENGPVFIAAGADFTVTVTAVDAEGDPTPNYGQESVPESVTFASGLVAAGGTANPPIVAGGGGSGFGPFAAGNATGTQFRWSEVGIITLTPSVADGSYLGTGDVVGNPSGNVGRFVPFDFAVVVDTAPVLATPCGVGGYGYVGQAFGWAQAPVLRVTARSVSGSTTRNYAGAWWKLTNAALAAAGGPVYLSDPGAPAALDPSGLPPAGTDPLIVELGDGIGTLTFSLGSGLRFARGGPVAPFDAEIALSIDVVDEDGVVYAANPFRVGDPSPGNGMAWNAGASQRYGRLALVNAFGSDQVALPVPLRAEYWTGSAFALHGSDSCTAVTAANVGTTARSPAALATSPVVGNLPLVAGDAGLFFTAPGSPGWADVLVNLSAVDVATPWGPIIGADLPWLRWDWSGDGAGPTYDESPAARITFGIFQGDAPVIFRREIY